MASMTAFKSSKGSTTNQNNYHHHRGDLRPLLPFYQILCPIIPAEVSLPYDALLYRSNSRKFFKNIYRTLVGQVKQHCHRSPGADGDNWGEAEG